MCADHGLERLDQPIESRQPWSAEPPVGVAPPPRTGGSGAGMPRFDRLIDALEAVVSAHPGTTFIGAHVGCAAEDLTRCRGCSVRYPNFHVDLGGRMAELGRQPRAAARLIADHPPRCSSGPTGSRWTRPSTSAGSASSRPPTSASGTHPRTRCRRPGAGTSARSTSLRMRCAALYADNARRVLGLGRSTDDRLDA